MIIRSGNYTNLYGWECTFTDHGHRHWFTFGKNCFGFEPSLQDYIKNYCGLKSYKDYQELKKEYPDSSIYDIKEIAKGF